MKTKENLRGDELRKIVNTFSKRANNFAVSKQYLTIRAVAEAFGVIGKSPRSILMHGHHEDNYVKGIIFDKLPNFTCLVHLFVFFTKFLEVSYRKRCL
jgi:hypothetical protein